MQMPQNWQYQSYYNFLGDIVHYIFMFNLNRISGPKLRVFKKETLNFRNCGFSKLKMLTKLTGIKSLKNKSLVMRESLKQILTNIQSVCFKNKPFRVVKRKPTWWNRGKNQ